MEDGIIRLTLSNHFNQSVKNLNFPERLKHLILGYSSEFNYDIKNANFPESLTYLALHPNYRKELENANFPK